MGTECGAEERCREASTRDCGPPSVTQAHKLQFCSFHDLSELPFRIVKAFNRRERDGVAKFAKTARTVENYFNYFSEIEEHYQRRRGTIVPISTLDWALIETWKNAGIPLEAVLRGIDSAFDRYEQRPSKSKKVNSLAYCAQEVLTAAEDMKEAAMGAATESKADRGFDSAEISEFMRRCARKLKSSKLPSRPGVAPEVVAREIAETLLTMADEIASKPVPPRLEDIERRLTVLEEKLFAVLLAAVPDDEVVSVRAQADRELAPYRSRMPHGQVEQLQKQYLHKKLLERYNLPRLSLFYL